MSELSAFYLTSLTKGSNSVIKWKPSAAAGRITDLILLFTEKTERLHVIGAVHDSTVGCGFRDVTLYFRAVQTLRLESMEYAPFSYENKSLCVLLQNHCITKKWENLFYKFTLHEQSKGYFVRAQISHKPRKGGNLSLLCKSCPSVCFCSSWPMVLSFPKAFWYLTSMMWTQIA